MPAVNSGTPFAEIATSRESMQLLESRRRERPPVTAALMLGLILSPVPLLGVEQGADIVFRALVRRHRDMFGRIDGDPSVLIDAVDLPWLFLIRPKRAQAVKVTSRRQAPPQADAVIRARAARLIDLLEGKVDGDALFFSRDLVIEGETAAVLSLRNALDSQEVRLVDDALSALGPFAGVAKGFVRAGLVLAETAAARLEHVLTEPERDGP